MFRPLPTTLQGSHSGFTDKQDKLLGVRGVWLIYGAVGEGNKSALTLFCTRLCSFSYSVFQSPSKMGVIIPILQIRKRIAQDHTVNEMANSDYRVHGSEPP